MRISGQKSKASPALSVINGRLHMVHLGDRSNRIWHSLYNGSRWTDNIEIPDQKSKRFPALATFQNQMHMVHLGDRSNDIWWSVFDTNYFYPRCELSVDVSFTQPNIIATGRRQCSGTNPPAVKQVKLRIRRHIPWAPDAILKSEPSTIGVVSTNLTTAFECHETATDFPVAGDHLAYEGAALYHADILDGDNEVRSRSITLFDCE